MNLSQDNAVKAVKKFLESIGWKIASIEFGRIGELYGGDSDENNYFITFEFSGQQRWLK